MNEEYLWNKTGEDAEIEKLENALQKFRYQEKFAPRVFVNDVKKQRFGFSFGKFFVPAAACLAFILLGLGLNSFIFKNAQNREISEKLSVENDKINSAPIILPTLKEGNSNISEANLSKKENIKMEKPLHKESKKIRVFKMQNARQIKSAKSKFANPKPTNILTKEEKYAYDQLMTALAITSSRLKQVQDKIYGAEN